MGSHPLIWWTNKNNVRSFYTVFGHTHEAFQDKLIIEHITNTVNGPANQLIKRNKFALDGLLCFKQMY